MTPDRNQGIKPNINWNIHISGPGGSYIYKYYYGLEANGLLNVGPHAEYEVLLRIVASVDTKNATFTAEVNEAGKTPDMKLGIIK